MEVFARRWVRGGAWVGLVVVLLVPGVALAHWCHDLWGSSYNVVVKPAADTVNVPAGGSGTLDVFVQNNMGYPLKNFSLRATASGYTIGIARQAPKVSGYLMPGENLRHTLTLSAASGGTLQVQSLNFYVDFGDGTQDQLYGGGNSGARHVAVRKNDGTVLPSSYPSYSGNGQALHLQSSSQADFGNLQLGLDALMTEYCAGRGSWDSGGGSSQTQYCNGTQTTCPPAVGSGRDDVKYDYQHLWAAMELAFRKSALGTRTAVLRERLKCGWNDNGVGKDAFRYFSLMMLGYLGEDAGARSFITNIINTGSADDKAVAKSALLLLGNAADKTQYGADVTAALGASSEYVQDAAAAALGIVDRNDAAVDAELIARARWTQPDEGDDGKAFFAAHLLNLVAWDRRGWAAQGASTGSVSFYGGAAADNTPPRAPANIACTAQSNGTVRVSFSQVTQDINGGAEQVTLYRVYRGTTARPAGVTKPGEQGFDYDHSDPTSSIYFDETNLDGTKTHYFTVTALDAAGNASVYGQEVNCVPRYAPVASLTCTPTTATAPAQVTCSAAASTDRNGPSDLASFAFRLDAQAPTTGTANQVSYDFAAAGRHVVQLTVTDRTGLTSTATANLTVNGAGGNQPPVAMAAGNPTNGPAPLAVSFSSAGSNDPDTGQTLSYSWDFGDGSPPSTQANPSHTFAAAGTFNVLLTVTDSAPTPASATALVTVRATGNQPPDATSASASPLFGGAPLLVRFDASGVSDPDGHNLSFTWKFGDGSADSTSRTVDHTYTQTGTFTATLTVRDDGQPPVAPVTVSYTINVGTSPGQNRPPDCAQATVSPLSGTAPFKVTLSGSGCVDPDGHALSFRWNVPTSTTTNAVYETAEAEAVLDQPGEVEVTLNVRDQASSPLEVDRTFTVQVLEPQKDGIRGGCSASGLLFPGTLTALIALGVRGRRRR